MGLGAQVTFVILQRLFNEMKFSLIPKLLEGVSKTFRTESITKYTLTFGITR
jgi:Na+-transporting NADH:ubiquinone oxidoreductase subunit NqrE